MRLLIVDDEDDFRETLRERFERKRFEVATAPDAEVALGLIEERSYDVMLLDVRMPGMDPTWHADERRWVRQGRLSRPGCWQREGP